MNSWDKKNEDDEIDESNETLKTKKKARGARLLISVNLYGLSSLVGHFPTARW